MADRFPLIVNASAGQIQELPNLDKLLLSGHLEFNSNNAACGDIVSTGGNDANFGIFCSTTVSDSSKISINGRNNAGNGNVSIAEFNVGASDEPELKCFGDITAFATSDRSYKDNLTPIPNALDKVGILTGYTFTWNSKSLYNGQDGVGVVAQEVEELGMAGITTTRNDGKKGVRYDRLTAILIEAVKELKKENDDLKTLIKNSSSFANLKSSL
tara:strand:- start:69 stop:710 length:642 start_codon:yes stop_codon:yes gene_type:complete